MGIVFCSIFRRTPFQRISSFCQVFFFRIDSGKVSFIQLNLQMEKPRHVLSLSRFTGTPLKLDSAAPDPVLSRWRRQIQKRLSSGPSPTVELLAGALQRAGDVDGSLLRSRFRKPTGVCVWGDHLIVCDHGNHCIRLIDGIVDVPLGQLSIAASPAEQLALISAAILKAIPILLKELAAIMSEYARPVGVCTIAGALRSSGGWTCITGGQIQYALSDCSL
jgi:hypothetical protein